MKRNIEAVAKFVIETEAAALSSFASDLPKDFSKTIEAMLKTRGRVVVSGVGKSGHVGKKIAATLASTGTPANFVHATEASHGDLGMITLDDFVCSSLILVKQLSLKIFWHILEDLVLVLQ